jgi:hypothetical protein
LLYTCIITLTTIAWQRPLMIGPSSSCTEVTVTKQKDPEAKETSPAHGMYMPLEELPVADPAVL